MKLNHERSCGVGVGGCMGELASTPDTTSTSSSICLWLWGYWLPLPNSSDQGPRSRLRNHGDVGQGVGATVG